MQILDALIESLRAARHIMVLSGAGISAESGLATFRTPQTGLWERFRPEELATPQAFRRDLALVWGWYEWRRMQVMRASPNPATGLESQVAYEFPLAAGAVLPEIITRLRASC